jgi:tRNA threonylcarbamoyladenosine biosynthesis protein TsaB
MILCIETATAVCSAALCDRSGPVITRESSAGRSHASALTPFIEEILKEAGITTRDLDAVAVSKGPGSYTGLRIGVSVAKGIAYASSISLIGVETTLSMFNGFMENAGSGLNLQATDILCPAIDARRMEVYYSLYDTKGNNVRKVRAEIMHERTFSDLPAGSRIILFGDGAAKCREVMNRNNIIFYDDFKITAASIRKPAFEALAGRRFEDIAYFEPLYLKDFIISKPVKNILPK